MFLVRGKYGKEKVVVVHKRGTTALVNYLFTLLALLVKKVMAFISLCQSYAVVYATGKRTEMTTCKDNLGEQTKS